MSAGIATESSAENYFDLRLREINQEMQSILEKTFQQRDDLRPIASMPSRHIMPGCARMDPLHRSFVPVSVPDAQHGSWMLPETHTIGSVPSASGFVGTLSGPIAECEIRRVCAAELQRWASNDLDTLLAPMVAAQVQKKTSRLEEEMHKTQMHLAETSAIAVALEESWKQQQVAMKAELVRVDKHVQRSLQQLEERFVEELGRLKTYTTMLRDSVGTMQVSAHAEQQRSERRLDELVKNHQEHVRASLSVMEHQVHEWRSEAERSMRQHLSQIKHYLDTSELQLARLGDVVHSTNNTTNAYVSDLQGLLDDAVEQRSEVRRCRRDVNRLEMMVQCVGNTGALRSAPADDASTQPYVPQALVQKLFKTRDMVGGLAGRIECIEKQLNVAQRGDGTEYLHTQNQTLGSTGSTPRGHHRKRNTGDMQADRPLYCHDVPAQMPVRVTSSSGRGKVGTDSCFSLPFSGDHDGSHKSFVMRSRSADQRYSGVGSDGMRVDPAVTTGVSGSRSHNLNRSVEQGVSPARIGNQYTHDLPSGTMNQYAAHSTSDPESELDNQQLSRLPLD